MAGAGFKTFNTGDVLTASDVNTYLMQQTVMVFADSSARTTALGANVAEGMISYLKDTNAVEVYDGSNWVSSDDPNAIQNTIVDAKGDLISATAADTPARLAVGTNGQVLTADSSTSTGLKWTSAGSMVLITSQSFNAASTINVNNCFNADYQNYLVKITVTNSSGAAQASLRMRSSGTDNSSAVYTQVKLWNYSGGTNPAGAARINQTSFDDYFIGVDSGGQAFCDFSFFRPFDTAKTGLIFNTLMFPLNSTLHHWRGVGIHDTAASYDGFSLIINTNNITGNIRVYGLRDA